jgi:uncharacterized protein YecE (DUF72 family)
VPKQLELFSRPALPTLAEPDPQMVRLAETVPKNIHLGTSSWTFPGWQGLVYRRRYRGEAHFMQESLYEYARFPVFSTVGIDRSFYNPLTREELTHYAALLPEGFRCVSKVWQQLTTLVFANHPKNGALAGKRNPSFLDVAQFSALIGDPYREAFSTHAGPFVLEISPLPRGTRDDGFFAARLEHFLRHAPPEFHYAVELRDASLMTPRYLEILRAYGASHCFNQWSRMPTIGEQLNRVGAPWTRSLVARLLLPENGDYETLKREYAPFDTIVAPDERMRADVLRLAYGAPDADLYIIINNKAEGSAPRTAMALAERLRRHA